MLKAKRFTDLGLDPHFSYTNNDLLSKIHNTNIFAKAIYKLSSHWESQTLLSTSNSSNEGRYVFLQMATLDSLNRIFTPIPSTFNAVDIQQNITGTFPLGPIKNRLLAGVDYVQNKSHSWHAELWPYDRIKKNAEPDYFSLQKLYSLMQNNTDITPLAGTTGLLKDCHTDRFLLPESILFLKNLPELETIAKRERFIDFGAAATLNTILELGEKNVPKILYQAISLAANPGVRSLATIGGNIAQAPMQNSCLIPLIALDTKIEIRTRKETFWMPLIQYCDESSTVLRQSPHIILRVRVPFEEWTISYYKRLGPIGHITADTASFVFMARTQKNLLSDVKLLFGSTQLIKSKEFENLLTGKGLPIDRRSVGALMKETEEIFSDTFSAAEISEFQKACFFNLIQESIYLLTN